MSQNSPIIDHKTKTIRNYDCPRELVALLFPTSVRKENVAQLVLKCSSIRQKLPLTTFSVPNACGATRIQHNISFASHRFDQR